MFYTYSFFLGGYLRYTGIKDPEYTGGTVITILYSILMGAFYLGLSGPHISSITQSKVAGKIAFETIDHAPSINIDEKGG